MVPPESTNRKLGLQDLVEDVLILILTECDVADAVALSATSKFLHNLAFTTTVWYHLVTKLAHRGFIDSGPDDGFLKDLSTNQLIDLVKRTLRGPRSWSETYLEPSATEKTIRRAANLFRRFVRKPPLQPPLQFPLASVPLVESRRIILHPEITGLGILYWQNKSILLPGGKFVLFNNAGRLECWSVFEDRFVWKHNPSVDNASVLEFSAELVEDDQAVILTCQRTWAPSRKNFVEIWTLDLKTGASNLELVSRVPDSNSYSPYNDCALCGEIAAVFMLSDDVLLINWRTNSRVMVLDDRSPITITLVPGYLVLSMPDSRTGSEYRLAVSPYGSITSWEPNDAQEEPSTRITVANFSVDGRDSIALPGYITRRCLWASESPLQRGRFKVWLQVNHSTTLRSYEFVKQDTGTGVSWRFLSSILMPDNFDHPKGITFSGHVLGSCTSHFGLEVFPPVPANKNSPRRTVDSLTRSDYVYLSPFSGTLTYSTEKELVVVYYD
ncbi:hypothetical protein MVEN_01195500 [Mycena venus]|uniref:F-box domain-containing protein n=1 Tax=Mycena venus TaxID=2733690 RepID=A0A8H7CYQ1_9AGAR|nr:hypothetical protein MVEN_01195500 [Mycena venus]